MKHMPFTHFPKHFFLPQNCLLPSVHKDLASLSRNFRISITDGRENQSGVHCVNFALHQASRRMPRAEKLCALMGDLLGIQPLDPRRPTFPPAQSTTTAIPTERVPSGNPDANKTASRATSFRFMVQNRESRFKSFHQLTQLDREKVLFKCL